ncbi:MAG TPA: ethylbenzene dehydrogenase-related protein, partial [Dehalococcoidia bacterium]
MSLFTGKGAKAAIVLLAALAVLALGAAACGDDDGGPSPTAEPTASATDAPTASPTAEPTEPVDGDEIAFDAATATITVDGDNSDWSDIEGVSVPLEQIEIPAGVDWDEPGPLEEIDVTLKVATDDQNIYALVEVPDDYNFDPADHNFSPSVAVMFLIDQAAGPHMGAEDEDLEVGLGMVDIWHWELDCAAGVMSGGGDAGSGDDPDCNLDDEFSTDPEEREDDGGGD